MAVAEMNVSLDTEQIVAQIMSGLREEIRNVVLEEAHHVLQDVEWRHQQVLERESGLHIARKVTAEDLNLCNKAFLTGYTVTNNSPVGGSIAWATLHIVYNGTDNTITDGNTANKYCYWVPGTSLTTMQTSNTKPTLGKDDLLVFVNNAGVATISATDGNASLPQILANSSVDSSAIATGAVTTGAIANNAVTSTQIANSTITSTQISGTAGITGGQMANSTVTSTQIASGAITAPKMNVLEHMLY